MVWISATVFLLSSFALAKVTEIVSSTFSVSEKERLASQLGIALGKPLDPARVNRGLHQLYKDGVQTLFVETENTPTGLRVSLRGGWRRKFRAVVFEGVRPEWQAEILAKLDFERGAEIEPRALVQAQELVQRVLEERGLFEARVHVATVPSPDGTLSDVKISALGGRETVFGRVVLVGVPESDKEELRRVLGIRKGDAFSKSLLDESVEKLLGYLRQNHYPLVQVEDQKLAVVEGNSLDLTLRIRLGDRVQFVFYGNTLFEDLQLRNLITEQARGSVDILDKLTVSIREKYQSVGYHFCTVRSEPMQTQETNLVSQKIIISEGPKVVIDAIEFRGAGELSPSRLREWFWDSGAGVVGRRLYWEQGVNETAVNLTKRLQKMGYLRATVLPPKTVFREDRKGARLFVDVELGNQTLLSQVQFRGNSALPEAQLLSEFALPLGSPFDPEELSLAKRRVMELYLREGYADFKWDEKASAQTFSADNRQATLVLVLSEGPRYFVGTVTVEGLKKTREEVVRREIKVVPGEPYSPQKVQETEDAVSTLGLFSRVEVVATPSSDAPHTKNLTVQVRETQPGIGEVGLGGVYEDPRFRIRGFVGLSYRNLLGLNQTVFLRNEITLPISREKVFPFIEYSTVLGYRAPYPLGLPVTGTAQVGLDRFEVSFPDSKLLTRARVEFRVEKKLSSRLALNYRVLRYELSKTEVLSSGASTKDIIGSTGPGLSLDFRDDPFNPTRGSFHTLDFEFAHPVLLSQSNLAFINTLLRNTVYVPFFSGLGLAVYGGVGYAKSLVDGVALPTARRLGDLSLGGQTSIRGFSVRRFFPGADAVESGLYNFRGELTARIVGDFSAAVFVDTGRIFPNMRADAQHPRHDGVGVGLRYRTPVGPVVLDVAQGLGQDRENVKFAFTIGTL